MSNNISRDFSHKPRSELGDPVSSSRAGEELVSLCLPESRHLSMVGRPFGQDTDGFSRDLIDCHSMGFRDHPRILILGEIRSKAKMAKDAECLTALLGDQSTSVSSSYRGRRVVVRAYKVGCARES